MKELVQEMAHAIATSNAVALGRNGRGATYEEMAEAAFRVLSEAYGGASTYHRVMDLPSMSAPELLAKAPHLFWDQEGRGWHPVPVKTADGWVRMEVTDVAGTLEAA